MIRAIAVDDEPVALDVIKMHAVKIPFIQLQATFTSAKEALAYCSQQAIDLIFMDISMPDISGLEMAEMLKHQSQIIFTTAHAEHALKGFELAATDYLLKPINFNRFLQACQLAQSRQGAAPTARPDDKSLFVKDGHNWIQIKHANIVYAQAQDNYVNIEETGKRTLTRMTLTELQEKLPATQFIRIHKSYIVPISRIEKIERHQVVIGEARIPVSPAFRDQLLAVFTGR